MEERAISDIAYQMYLSEEKLMGSKCVNCGAVYAPPRPLCTSCRKSDMQWIEMKGEGKLAAFTCISIGPAFMAAEGYDRKNPYCVGVIELDEGPRVDVRVEGFDASKPDTIHVGSPMKVKFLHRGEGMDKTTYLGFEPS